MRVNNASFNIIDNGAYRVACVTSVEGDADNSLEIQFNKPSLTSSTDGVTTYTSKVDEVTVFPEEGKTLVINDQEYRFHTQKEEFEDICEFCSFHNRSICLRINCYKKFFAIYIGNKKP